MTHAEMSKANLLIARFVGHSFQMSGINDYPMDYAHPEALAKQIRYDLDWSLLMPVVKKISCMTRDKPMDYHMKLAMAKRWKPLANELQNVNRIGIWYCAVKFIEWYNKQK